MKKIIILFALLLGACSPVNDDAEQARQTLVAFFDALNQARYEDAVDLYGGSYEIMIDHNPSLNPEDHIALWKYACTINGAQCLIVRSATLQEGSGDEYIFIVEFNNPDATLFVLSPCCGASETDMPSVSQFEYRVEKTAEGNFLVLDLPVYVP